MMGLDTHVLMRYLLNDDEEQSRRAVALINETADLGEKMYISHVVVCEVAWVLRSAGDLPRVEIAEVLNMLLHTAQFAVEDPDLAGRALARYGRGGADFPDYLIAERASEAGCERVATFDKKLLKEPGFVSP